MKQKYFFAYALFFVASFFTTGSFAYADHDTTDKTHEQLIKEAEEEAEKKEKEDDLKDDLEKVEKKLEKAEQEKAAAQSVYNARSNDLSQQRYALAKTTEDVQSKEQEIAHYDEQLKNLTAQKNLHKKTLEGVMRQLYFVSSVGSVSHVFDHESDEQFLLSEDRIGVLRQEMLASLDIIGRNTDDANVKQEAIEQAKTEKEELLAEQKKQELALANVAAQAQQVVSSKQANVDQLNSKMAGLQSDLSSLLGKGVSSNDIVEAAEFASDKTGVRKSFILGMLIVETDLGRFTGGCTYKESNMSEYRKGIFKKIADELDKDYKKLKVSCPPSNYKGTGGAMGVAQFMSDTWWGYKSKIASKTGNNPPNPWSLTDGVMAMAIKLANDGATKTSGEWNAAARYLGSCSGNTAFYCENVLYWADNYKKKL